MSLKTIIFFGIVVLFICDRILLFITSYTSIRKDLEEDIEFFVRNCVESEALSKLGRRFYLCDEIKQRSSVPLFIHTFQFVVDDTVNTEVSYQQIIKIALVIVSTVVCDRFISRYTRDDDIPVFKTLKRE